jgi:hypothetical protein
MYDKLIAILTDLFLIPLGLLIIGFELLIEKLNSGAKPSDVSRVI